MPPPQRLINCLLGLALVALLGCAAGAYGADVPRMPWPAAAGQPEQRAGVTDAAAPAKRDGHVCTRHA
ncbi:hypothetical protein, partial [Streptomyces alkaliterrae]